MTKTPGRFKHATNSAWRRVENEAIILDLETSVYYSLNDVGALIWERLGAGVSPDEIAAEVSGQYDVSSAQAEKDVRELAQKLCDEKLLQAA